MVKNILIGNGINLANENDFLNIESVKERFFNILEEKYTLFREALYLEALQFNEIKKSVLSKRSLSIEGLAGNLFEYIKHEIENIRKFCWNDCYRIIEIIGVICIESLFIVDKKLKYPKISKKYIKKISSYNNVFTLNYVEDWDENHECIYLHGRIKKYLNEYNGEYLMSYILMQTPEIRKLIPKNVLKIDLYDVIFIPDNEMVYKYHYVGLGLFPNKCNLDVYPAPDLFPHSGKGDIYKCLDNLKSIEIFGVSPYGDKSIFKKTSKIEDVTIYIYNMAEDKEEVTEWKKYVPHAIFKDSMDFLD